MSYSDALVSQLYLLDYWRHNSEESEFISEQLGDAISSARALQRDVVNMISQAETYYVSDEIANVLVGGFGTLPATPLGDIRPSSPYGWAYFERPVLCPFPRPSSHTGGATGLWKVKGLLWGPQPQGLNLCIFIQHPWSSHVPCSGMTNVSWSSSWVHAWDFTHSRAGLSPGGVHFSRFADRDLSHWISKLYFSLFAFIRQTCISIQATPPSRPIRRHLPPTFRAEPVIRIIQLRRRSPAANGRGTQPRDYSCRWLVRGHWRNQFYPSSKNHRPRFIPAYVKGPDDKPLKRAAKVSLFAVVR